MSTINDKYLVLRGKNKDIYFIQKRLSKEAAAIFGKGFIKKSLETTDIQVARAKRDTILHNIDEIIRSNAVNNGLNKDNSTDFTQNKEFETKSVNKSLESKNMHVPIKDYADLNAHEYSKNTNFNFFSIKIPKLPKKEEIIMKIDGFIPIAILILTLFIAFIV